MPDGVTGDCPSGSTFWDNVCSSVCPEGYSIFDGVTCTKDCPSGFLSSSESCFKPVTLRDPVHATCPLNYEASSANICYSTLPPFNSTLLWLVIGIGLVTVALILLFTKDVTFTFASKAKQVEPKQINMDDEIPTRFLIDELKNGRNEMLQYANDSSQAQMLMQQQQQAMQNMYFPGSPNSFESNQSMSSAEWS